MVNVDSNICRNEAGHFVLSNSNGISLQAYDRANLNQQLEANGFSETECSEVWGQLAATGKASIRISTPWQRIRQVT